MPADVDRRTPSTEQLDELAKSLEQFVWQDEPSFCTDNLSQEKHRYPGFVRVVEAVRPLRNLNGTEGWPTWLVELIAALIKAFDVLAYSWGWGELLKPEECRAAYIRRCEDKFRATYLQPIQEAANACRANYSVIDCPAFLDDLCEKVPPIEYDLMFLNDDQGRLNPLREAVYRKRRAFLLGESYPTISELGGSSTDFTSDACLGSVLKSVAQKITPLVARAKANSIQTPVTIVDSVGVPPPAHD